MPAENGIPENEDVKKKALLRLAVAGAVTVAALGGLWWLDQGGVAPKKTVPAASAPAPIVAAPQPEVRAPETEAPAPDAETPPPDQETAAPSTPAATKQAESPPPPPRVSNAPRSTPAPQSAPRPMQTPVPPSRPAAVPPQAMPQVPPPGAGNGYIVQLGVFANPDNARELVNKLNKQGIRAHLEARVQIGPFLNRQEAEKAQVEMRKLGYNALVTLPYSAPPATK
ncbi:MAG: hypothetical protein B7Y41_13405 [Hydrogenophilales bacterium 28-61-23]|nr:MAG: hypothetical protein B7Y41_13405 [Hydrogenophilales bacterium 28-61-23]